MNAPKPAPLPLSAPSRPIRAARICPACRFQYPNDPHITHCFNCTDRLPPVLKEELSLLLPIRHARKRSALHQALTFSLGVLGFAVLFAALLWIYDPSWLGL